MAPALTTRQLNSLQHAAETSYVSGKTALSQGPEARLLTLEYVTATPRFEGSNLVTVTITAQGRKALAAREEKTD